MDLDVDDLHDRLFAAFKSGRTGYLALASEIREELARVASSVAEPTSTSFVPYPSLDDPSFNEKISRKKEFRRGLSRRDDAASKARCGSKTFAATANQRFVRAFLSPLTPYNSVLLFHGTGVGKTCSAIGIAEQFHDVFPGKKVLVFAPSGVIPGFRRQIFDPDKVDTDAVSRQCTGSTYAGSKGRGVSERYEFLGFRALEARITAISNDVVRRELNRSVDETEDDYARRIGDIVDAQVADEYSHRVVVVDEVHNVKNTDDGTGGVTAAAFLRLFRVASGIKLVLMSATPMFDQASEIVWLLNLMRANDRRPLVSVDGLFDKDGRPVELAVREACRGYVSWMRGDPFSFPTVLYPPDTDTMSASAFPTKDPRGDAISEPIRNLRLVPSEMSPEHFETTAGSHAGDHETTSRIQASNVFFGASAGVGQAGFTSVFAGADGAYVYRDPKQQILSYPDALQRAAPKIKRVVDLVCGSTGIALVYSQYIWAGSKAIALALEHVGFTRYGSTGQDARSRGLDVRSRVPKGKRWTYAVVSGSEGPADDDMRVLSSPGNSAGDVIKVAIVSRVGAEGLDLKNIREIHVLEPWFNLSRIDQVVGRGARTCSHVDLPEEHRNVTVFLHVSTPPAGVDVESIDLYTYRNAEAKQLRIIEVEKILQQSSVDCLLNRDVLDYSEGAGTIARLETSQGRVLKNYPRGDQPGTRTCGFGSCARKCSSSRSPKDVVDLSTWSFDFLKQESADARRLLFSAFASSAGATFPGILARFPGVDPDVLRYALHQAVTNQTRFKNAAGVLGYLIARGAEYLFQPAVVRDLRLPSKYRVGLSALLHGKRVSKGSTTPRSSKRAASTAVSSDAQAVLARLRDARDDLYAKYTEIVGVSRSEEREVSALILDACVDRLVHREHVSVVRKLSEKIMSGDGQPAASFEKDVSNSLEKLGVMYPDQQWYWDAYQQKMFKWTGSWVPCIDEDYTDALRLHMNRMRAETTKVPGTCLAYMCSKQRGSTFDAPVFKITTPVGGSYVCNTDSTHFDEFKRGVAKDLGLDVGRLRKGQLCLAYEMHVRRNFSHRFHRLNVAFAGAAKAR